MQLGLGLSNSTEPLKAVKEAVSKAFSNLGRDTISLGLIFSEASLESALVLKACKEVIADTPLLGISAESIISKTGLSDKRIAIVLFSFSDQIYFNTACVKDINKNSAFALGEKLGEDLLYGCKGIRRNLSIIFSDAYTPDAQSVTLGLQERVGRAFPIIGAFVYKDNSKTNVYFLDSTVGNAACGVLFGGKLNFGLGIKHGWKPIGKPRVITNSVNNIVLSIDNNKALRFYQEYFAKDIATLKKETPRISAFYPLGIEAPEEKEYLLRSILSIEDDGSLVFNGNIPQGSRVRLMIASKESALESIKDAAHQAKNSLGGVEPKLVIVFNSVSISRLLGQEEKLLETEIKRVFGERTPILVLCTNAQQAPLNREGFLGKTYFHNNSVTVLALSG